MFYVTYATGILVTIHLVTGVVFLKLWTPKSGDSYKGEEKGRGRGG